MKLIIAGSTGFVATELIRQALPNPSITSIIALARRPTPLPSNLEPYASKFKSVTCSDFSNYSEDVKKEFVGADACIWTIAVLPSQLRTMTPEDVHKICHDYTVTGLETMTPIASKPFRFIYISGSNAVRDQSQKPWIMGDYLLMRGHTETWVLDYATQSNGAVQACIAKPGMIHAPGHTTFWQDVMKGVVQWVIGLPKVECSQVAAALIEQVVKGVEKDTLVNEDLVRIGGEVGEKAGEVKQ